MWLAASLCVMTSSNLIESSLIRSQNNCQSHAQSKHRFGEVS